MTRMTAEDFRAWMVHTKMNVSTAAKELGISRNSVAKYLDEGAPLYIGLACTTLALGYKPWKAPT